MSATGCIRQLTAAALIGAVVVAGCTGAADVEVSVGDSVDSVSPTSTGSADRSGSEFNDITIREAGLARYSADESVYAWGLIVENTSEEFAATDVVLEILFTLEDGTVERIEETIPVVLPGVMGWGPLQSATDVATPGVMVDGVVSSIKGTVSEVGSWERYDLERPPTSVLSGSARVFEETDTVIEYSLDASSEIPGTTNDILVVFVFRDEDGQLLGASRVSGPLQGAWPLRASVRYPSALEGFATVEGYVGLPRWPLTGDPDNPVPTTAP